VNFTLPPVGFGPGSQPAPEDGELSYMAMPSGMRVFEAHIPEVRDRAAAKPAIAFLQRVAEACRRAAETGRATALPLDGLDPAARALVHEALGEGEVSATLDAARGGRARLMAQEAVFAGVWRVREGDATQVEIGAIPAAVTARAHEPVDPALGLSTPPAPGVMSAPPLVAELIDRAMARRPGDLAHVINLTLLPHTPEDLAHLDRALGRGAATILSRGYGNCRVSATATPKVWRVQFFNSMDALILDTIEATETPEVALAAPEDLLDSAERIAEVLEAMG
jgi:hydrogenase-1 operon protein HyaF